jgi:hypothetical protein
LAHILAFQFILHDQRLKVFHRFQKALFRKDFEDNIDSHGIEDFQITGYVKPPGPQLLVGRTVIDIMQMGQAHSLDIILKESYQLYAPPPGKLLGMGDIPNQTQTVA